MSLQLIELLFKKGWSPSNRSLLFYLYVFLLVSNSGGIGTVGAIGWTPAFLKEQLDELKRHLKHPDLPFGVDLALPKVGDGARKTNYVGDLVL